MSIRFFTIILTFGFCHIFSFTQNVDLTIKNINNDGGMICVAVFANQNEFQNEKPFFDYKIQKSDSTGEILNVQLSLRPGHYGISVLHDKNKNGKMDYNIIGVPREGFGFSGYYLRGLKKPSFDDFAFWLEKNEKKKITVYMKYF